MMLIPIGHDHGALRRWPAITFAIMGLCSAVAFVQYDAAKNQAAMTKKALQEVLEYYDRNPDLEADPELAAGLHQGLTGLRGILAQLPAPTGKDEPLVAPKGDAATRAERQQTLDRLTHSWVTELHDNMIWHWGFIPADFSWIKLVTSMFVHAGAMHLLFNMLFLYMTGPFVEDVWGRPVFLAFYLLGGMFAGGMFAWQDPGLAVPLVGASGAVAGVMGAFLVRYPTAKIRLLTFLGWRKLIFSAPAWLLISLWFVGEYAEARVTANLGDGGVHVANWAHLWGFAFGAAIAAVIRALRLEETYFFDAIEQRREAETDPLQFRLDRLLAQGDTADACRILAAEILLHPEDPDRCEMYWRLARGGVMATQASVCLRIIRNDLQQRREDVALERWGELRRAAPEAMPDTHLGILLAQCLTEHGRGAEGDDLLAETYRRLGPASPAEEWAELAQYCIASARPMASEVATRALAHPRLTAPLRESLQQAL